MNENALRLPLSTRAIVGNEEAVHLIEQKERLESALLQRDAPLSLDLSKAFLETIFKTIINDRVAEANTNLEFGPLFRTVKDNLDFSENTDINNLLGLLAGQIVNVTGQLRNRYGAASHGDDGYHTNPIKMVEAEFIASSVDGLASCIYKKHKETLEPEVAHRLRYDDYPEFNDWLDEQFDGYNLPLGNGNIIQFTASQMVFQHDMEGYREMLVQYSSTEEEEG
ncbi:abortive infection protein [Pseudoalteromonas sp. S3785]|uniref:abortive infection family protein n=1 Tax=Pseudoalteromonas sp. S3785 TaxID=579545 RepID=UPI00110ACB1A|nr:abortive infection family protein [Pseudoalteromonas sp. S3785]TMO77335.1 abortive infection protein [Pseudoalteromonas sp. S3785]